MTITEPPLAVDDDRQPAQPTTDLDTFQTAGSPRPGSVPSTVVKRDGRVAVFDVERIASAITRAGAATGEFTGVDGRALADVVVRQLSGRPRVEEIQDMVETTLLQAG